MKGLTPMETVEMLCIWRLSDLSKACRYYRDKSFVIPELNRILKTLNRIENNEWYDR